MTICYYGQTLRTKEKKKRSASESPHSEKIQIGIDLFNAGEYFRAHEVWEEIWLAASGRDKIFLQGLIQLAASFHHFSRGNVSGAASLLEASSAKLVQFPAVYRGITLRSLLERMKSCLASFKKGQTLAEMDPPQIEFTCRFANAEDKEAGPAKDQQSARPSSPNAQNRKRRNI